MPTKRIALVQASWADVQPQVDELGRLFYQKLFEIAPSMRALFQDLPTQQRKFQDMLGMLVQNLDQREGLMAVQALGREHRHYGVHDEFHEPFGTALIWALAQLMGERFTPELRQAWLETYVELSTMMMAARHHAA